MQQWKKKGLVFKPGPPLKESITHCQHATPLHLEEDIYRIFFGSRNANNLTQIFFFDFDIKNLEVLSHSSEPVLFLGEMGFFDQHGIYPSSVIEEDGQCYLYTIGFTQGVPPLYYTRVGLAVCAKETKVFKKYSKAPVLNVSDYDPCTVTGPFVLKEEKKYRVWYVSGYKWDKDQMGELRSHYHIKYAESEDGINWKREGLVSIDHVHPGETNIARPWILKEEGIYKAWFSYNCGKEGYRIGYAESTDGGYTFQRKDHEANLHPSDEPWENQAVAYPAVISHQGKKYMFYNGNSFGKDGIALAVEE